MLRNIRNYNFSEYLCCPVCNCPHISAQPTWDANAAEGYYSIIGINNTNPIVSCSPYIREVQVSLQMVSEDTVSVSAACWSIRPSSTLSTVSHQISTRKQCRPHKTANLISSPAIVRRYLNIKYFTSVRKHVWKMFMLHKTPTKL